MDKRTIIEQELLSWEYLTRLNYSFSKKDYIDNFKSGYKNFLSISFGNHNRKLNFGFFEYDGSTEINDFSLLINCIDCKNVQFNIFSIDEYLKKNGMPEKKSLFSLNAYPGLTITEKIKSVLHNFENELNNPEIMSMLKGETWLDGYYNHYR